VYEYNTISHNWVKLGGETIVGYYAYGTAGHSVSLNGAGDIVAVGSPGQCGGKGSAEVWEYDGCLWNKKGTIVFGDQYEDNFGHFVSISDDGNRLAVGAPFADSNAGRVKVFNYNSDDDAWVQIGTNIDGDAAGENFGYSGDLSANGNYLIVGAPKHNSNSPDPSVPKYAGVARVYKLATDS